MNLTQTIRQLRDQKKAVEDAIECLEALLESRANPSSSSSATPRRRGRKSMDARERAEVSERMKGYWANRRVPKTAREREDYCTPEHHIRNRQRRSGPFIQPV